MSTEPPPALPAASAPRPRRPLGRRLAFAFIVLVAFFAVTEGVLGVTMPAMRHATLPNEMIKAHLDGAAFRYDKDLYWYWPDPLGGPGSPVNEFGFVRKKPMQMKRPEGVTRVVTFGDSQTFGAGMPADKTYSAFAEAAMGEGWEVLNAGISGYRSLNVYRLLQLRIGAFEPNAIVIDCMPFDSTRDDGPIIQTPLEDHGPVDWMRRMLWRSRIYYLLRLGMEHFNPNRPRWLDDVTARQHRGNTLDGNHDLIAQWGKERGVEVFFMQYPIMDEQGQFGCMTGPGELPPDHYIVPACDRLKASGRPAKELFQDRNHLTEEGNKLVGEIVADTLRDWKAGKPRPGLVERLPDAPDPGRTMGPADQGSKTVGAASPSGIVTGNPQPAGPPR